MSLPPDAVAEELGEVHVISNAFVDPSGSTGSSGASSSVNPYSIGSTKPRLVRCAGILLLFIFIAVVVVLGAIGVFTGTSNGKSSSDTDITTIGETAEADAFSRSMICVNPIASAVGPVCPPTLSPTPRAPTTRAPTTRAPTTRAPTTMAPTTRPPTTRAPTTPAPTTRPPTTMPPVTTRPPTTPSPTTRPPTTSAPVTTRPPTTPSPTARPTLPVTTRPPTTPSPTTRPPTTSAPVTTRPPTTPSPTTRSPTTSAPVTTRPPTQAPTTSTPTTLPPTPTPTPTPPATTRPPTTRVPTTVAPTTAAPTTPSPTTRSPTTRTPTTIAPALPRLHISGSQLVDHNNHTVFLRGWNWGHWGSVQPQDALDNKVQGANMVRIPLRWWGCYTSPDIDSRNDTAPGLVNPANLAILDQTIQWAVEQQLWIDLFIDSNCGQDGLQPAPNSQSLSCPQVCDPEGKYNVTGRNFFTDQTMRDKFIVVWKFIANRYKNIPYLAIFEPLPEPGNEYVPDANITAFYDLLMTEIRSVAPGIPFILGGTKYQNGKVSKAYHSTWTDVIYTANLFLFADNPDKFANLRSRVSALTSLRNTYNVPVFIQQTGAQTRDDPDFIYTDFMLDLMNQEHVGWCWWEYRDGISPESFAPYYLSSNKPDAVYLFKNETLIHISDGMKQSVLL